MAPRVEPAHAICARVAGAKLRTGQAAAAAPARPATIEVVLVGGRTLRVGADVDTVALLRIVEALEAHR